MQRGVGHRHAADEHRGQLGHRGQFAGAADLHINGQHGGELFLRRVLVRHGPARFAGHKTQLALLRQAVDLVDHTVNVIGQRAAVGADLLVKCY